MLNQVVLVGRLNNDVIKNNNGNNSIITLAVPRSWKNADGEYETDFIDCVLTGSIAENTSEYCKKGDIIGVKGRLQSNDETEYKIKLVAEKVTFLSARNNE